MSVFHQLKQTEDTVSFNALTIEPFSFWGTRGHKQLKKFS